MNAFPSRESYEKFSQKLREQQHKPGLYLVATPIGNIFDISLRALYILGISERIFAEDTRRSRKLLNFYGIKTPLISCREHNEDDFSVLSEIREGGVYSLISDAGTPLISDPGYRLVNRCLERRTDVFPIPGPSSAVAGLIASGLPTDRFLFQGFLPAKSSARRTDLKELKEIRATLVFFESPGRVLQTLEDMLEIFGERRCCICREITKIFEEFRRGNLSEMIHRFSETEPIGEFVLVIEGNNGKAVDEAAGLFELAELLKTETLKSAVDRIARKYGLSRKKAYEKALQIKGEIR
ncbi:MAG: 16S rRNA (cytidine(1402)-2'-O)-methyltransferase [Holosporaceae bacterium]|nr:16S rRNA (cytidine(1402)-2'-O)-methyltransferase [Holosporaceae bacterium]